MTEPKLEYATRAIAKPHGPEAREVVMWCGLVPLFVGVAATAVHLLTGGGGIGPAVFIAAIAGMASLLCVPAGLIALGVHLYRGAPERDGRHRVRRTVVSLLPLLCVWPAAWACSELIDRLDHHPRLTVVNGSGTPVTLDVPWRNVADGGTRTITLAPGARTETTLTRFIPSDSTVSVLPQGPAITVTPPPKGTLAPLRGYEVQWDGTKWVRVR